MRGMNVIFDNQKRTLSKFRFSFSKVEWKKSLRAS